MGPLVRRRLIWFHHICFCFVHRGYKHWCIVEPSATCGVLAFENRWTAGREHRAGLCGAVLVSSEAAAHAGWHPEWRGAHRLRNQACAWRWWLASADPGDIETSQGSTLLQDEAEFIVGTEFASHFLMECIILAVKCIEAQCGERRMQFHSETF